MTDLQSLKLAPGTQVYLVGDVHGSAKELEAFLSTIEEENKKNKTKWAAILLGDVFDRGKDNPGVMRLIKEKNSKGEKRVYVVKGNHEYKFEQYIAYQLSVEQSPERENWLKDYKGDSSYGFAWKAEIKKQELNEYRQFIADMPIILHVEGGNSFIPFNCAHAALPFSDTVLDQRLKNKEGLKLSEKIFALFARVKEINRATKGPKADSRPTYVGHNILGGLRPARAEINLDVGTYREGYFIVINHTKGECFICNAKGRVTDFKKVPKEIVRACALNNFYLQRANKSADEIDACIKTHFLDQQATVELQQQQYQDAFFFLQPALSAEQQRKLSEHILDAKEHLMHKYWSARSAKEINAYIMEKYVNKKAFVYDQKQQYLRGLNLVQATLSKTQKQQLALYLLKEKEHLLKIERFYFLFSFFSFLGIYKTPYSNETRSIHTAVKRLVGDDANLFKDDGKKIRVFPPNPGEAVSTFTPHIFSRRP